MRSLTLCFLQTRVGLESRRQRKGLQKPFVSALQFRIYLNRGVRKLLPLLLSELEIQTALTRLLHPCAAVSRALIVLNCPDQSHLQPPRTPPQLVAEGSI